MEPKWKEGFKVLNAGRRSCTIWGPFAVEYLENEPVKPKKDNGPLCVFKDLKYAQKFMGITVGKVNFDRSHKIVPCRFTESKKKRVWVHGYESLSDKLKNLPKGTILADQVICLE
jgi:hypothetical protein